MTTYRNAKPEEFLDCIDLGNAVFSQSSCPHNFSRMIPKVYGEDKNNASIHKVAVSEDGRLRAQVACLPQTLSICGYPLRAGFIGTVSVHPRARGEGHMKALMNAWIEEMRETCDLSVLGGQRQRYEYFGYTHGGQQMVYTVNSSNIRHALRGVDASPFSFRPLEETPEAVELALSLHNARIARVERSADLFSDILRTFGEQPLAVCKNEKPVGYLLLSNDNKSILELALSQWEDFEPMLKAYMQSTGTQQLTIPTPVWDTELNRRLSVFAESYRLEQNEMFRIFQFANVLEAYLTLKLRTEGLTPGVFSAILDGQPVTVRVDDTGLSVERSALPGAPELTLREAQELLLTPHGRWLPVQAPNGWFPLPIFWYAADNF